MNSDLSTPNQVSGLPLTVIPPADVFGQMMNECPSCHNSHRCQSCVGSASSVFLGIPSAVWGNCKACGNTGICPHCKKK